MSERLLETRIGIDQRRAKIEAFCRRWHVAELAVFGSILRADFTDRSDIDVLITPEPGVVVRLGDLLDMQAELAAVFERDIDLGTRRSVEQDPNYLRRRAILGSARTIYAKR